MITHTTSETTILEMASTMASTTTLQIANRSTNQPIKNLPASIEVTEKTTVHDVKEQLSRLSGGRDPNRFGLYDSEKKKILKDRKAFILQQSDVVNSGKILVKDLGPQLSWTSVFLIEYFGPIWIHLAVPFVLRPYIYGDRQSPPLSSSQKLACAMIVLHFIKRELETIFVHKFSLSTMPLTNIFKNSAHYWLGSGAFLAYSIYHPSSYTQIESPSISYVNLLGLVLYIFGEVSNAHTHLTLSRLRSRGGTERGIPRGYGFEWVTCPNYFFEIIAWFGVNLVAKSTMAVAFTAIAWAQMHIWARKKEEAYRSEFPETYKKKRNVMFPFF